ncbi:hypothetical protein [Sulfurimonas sp.]|uniref:hypothetical protein n=1 Tax=Sulfurimonas sp. TaxID=2022749 RepID=UPI003D10F2D4
MKKLIFLLFSTILLVSQANAKEYTKEEEEAMIQQIMQNHKEMKESSKRVAEAKAETESAKRVNQKLDEILGVLEKDKK